MRPRKRQVLVLFILVVLLIGSMLLASTLGAVSIPLSDIVKMSLQLTLT